MKVIIYRCRYLIASTATGIKCDVYLHRRVLVNKLRNSGKHSRTSEISIAYEYAIARLPVATYI